MSDKFTTYGPSGMPCMCVPFLSGTPLPVLLFRSDSECAPLLQRIADAGFIVVVSTDLAAALAEFGNVYPDKRRRFRGPC